VPRLLGDNGFDFELPAYFIWEGNTMYLTKEAVIGLLTDLTRSVRRFGISFDYMSEEVISHTTGDQRMTDFVGRFEAMGAPWRFGINDLKAIADTTGMTIIDNVKMADLHRTYRPGGPNDPIFEQYSLCTLEPNP
jgi:O-methyltransferase involved in polyketide biosynthesis